MMANFGFDVIGFAAMACRNGDFLQINFVILWSRQFGLKVVLGINRATGKREAGSHLTASRLDQLINTRHALVKPAPSINRRFLEKRTGAVYSNGRRSPHRRRT